MARKECLLLHQVNQTINELDQKEVLHNVIAMLCYFFDWMPHGYILNELSSDYGNYLNVYGIFK